MGLVVWESSAQTSPQPGGPVEKIKPSAEPLLKRPAESAPQAPQIACANGTLGILAENSTLGSVAAAIHSCLGIPMDLPEGTSGSRVFTHLSPGVPQEVLLEFLNSTGLDYVIQTSVADSHKIQAVLLFERTSDAKDHPVLNADAQDSPTRRAWIESRNALRAAQVAGEERLAAEGETETFTPSEQPAAPERPAYTTTANAAPESPVRSGDTSSTPPTSQSAGADAVAAPASGALPSPASGASGSPPVSPTADAAADTPAAKETQKKILSLEQMFEQRKKMMEGQADNPGPQ